jgi:hypothetical protein
MGKKLTYEFVKGKFEKKGWKLLSKEYVSSDIKLDFICDRGHSHSMSFNNIKKDTGCFYCYNEDVKPTLIFIKQKFFEKNLELLSTEYINSKTKLEYRCKKCSNIHSIAWDTFINNHGCPVCYWKSKFGERSPTYKGGVKKLNLPLYKTYAHQLEKYEQVHIIQQGDLYLLGVNCLYCNKILVPKQTHVRNRIRAIEGVIGAGQARFYCSDGCKQACPIFWKTEWPEGYAPATSREMQPQFRKMVLERDNWTCQKCGINKESNIETELHAHHIDPVINNPIESCDVDNGITLCVNCHHEVHQLPGCTLNELKCDVGGK